MTGNNHYPDCLCGWCVGGWRNSPTERTISQPKIAAAWPKLNATFATYTVPNAFCPVCGASVYFYASPFGGRVFFDDLGPPWPKHPCTDNESPPKFREFVSRTIVNSARIPEWQRLGWAPVSVERVDRIGEWALIEARRLDTRASFTRLTPWHECLVPGTPALVKAPDVYGVGRISWIFAREDSPTEVNDILCHRALAVPVQALRVALGDDANSAAEVGYTAAFAWGEKRVQSRDVVYPAFVNWRISRAWLQRAADLGSERASLLLNDPVWNTVKWK
jgi:hypothetical protein